MTRPPAVHAAGWAGAALAACRADLAAVEAAWANLTASLTDAQFARRPAHGRWSVGEHLAHLTRVDASYLPYLDRMLAHGRARGLTPRARPSRVPPPGRWLGDLLVRLTEPPVRIKVRTSAPYVPSATLDRHATRAAFTATRRALDERIAATAGLDPARLRARYAPGLGPARLVTLSFGQWLALIAAHDRRHLWLAERGVGVLNRLGVP